MMQNGWVETLTGAIILGIAAFLLTYAYTKTKPTESTSYLVHAHFDRIDGLNVGSDVRMSGIKIGKVVAQRINPKNYGAQVTFALDPSLRIPKDSSAAILSESLLGGKYVDIVPGGETELARSGDELEQTQSSVNIESLIGKMMFSKDDEKAK